MDDNKVAVLLEQLLSEFRTFGEGLQNVRNEQKEQRQILNGLVDGMDIVKPTLKGLIADMDVIKPSLSKINNRLDSIENKIIKLNSESREVFFKEIK